MSVKNHPIIEQQVGRYKVLRQIGQGGMATVFLAQIQNMTQSSESIDSPWNPSIQSSSNQHINTDQWVALKLLHPHLATDPKAVRRFWEEISVASQLKHPHICHVLDLGEYDGVPYLVMPFLRGKSIAQLIYSLDKHPLPLVVAMSIILDLAHGLAYAQQLTDSDARPLGLIHRDISPHNAFVEFNGLAKILDFGIAHIKKVHHSTLGNQLGKVAYMAPEQFEGAVTQQTDLWSLAVTAWELLTLRPLFDAEHHMKAMYQVLNAEIPKISEYRDDIPVELEQSILNALQRDVNHRPQSIQLWITEMQQSMSKIPNFPQDENTRRELTAAWLKDKFSPDLELDEYMESTSHHAKDQAKISKSTSTSDTPDLNQLIHRSTQVNAHTYPSEPYQTPPKKKRVKFVMASLMIILTLIAVIVYFTHQNSPKMKPTTQVLLGDSQRIKGVISIESYPCPSIIYNETNKEYLGNTPLKKPLPEGMYSLSLRPTRKKKSCHTRSILVEIKPKTIQVYKVDLTLENSAN